MITYQYSYCTGNNPSAVFSYLFTQIPNPSVVLSYSTTPHSDDGEVFDTEKFASKSPKSAVYISRLRLGKVEHSTSCKGNVKLNKGSSSGEYISYTDIVKSKKPFIPYVFDFAEHVKDYNLQILEFYDWVHKDIRYKTLIFCSEILADSPLQKKIILSTELVNISTGSDILTINEEVPSCHKDLKGAKVDSSLWVNYINRSAYLPLESFVHVPSRPVNIPTIGIHVDRWDNPTVTNELPTRLLTPHIGCDLHYNYIPASMEDKKVVDDLSFIGLYFETKEAPPIPSSVRLETQCNLIDNSDPGLFVSRSDSRVDSGFGTMATPRDNKANLFTGEWAIIDSNGLSMNSNTLLWKPEYGLNVLPSCVFADKEDNNTFITQILFAGIDHRSVSICQHYFVDLSDKELSICPCDKLLSYIDNEIFINSSFMIDRGSSEVDLQYKQIVGAKSSQLIKMNFGHYPLIKSQADSTILDLSAIQKSNAIGVKDYQRSIFKGGDKTQINKEVGINKKSSDIEFFDFTIVTPEGRGVFVESDPKFVDRFGSDTLLEEQREASIENFVPPIEILNGATDELLLPHEQFSYENMRDLLFDDRMNINMDYVLKVNDDGSVVLNIPIENPIKYYTDLASQFIAIDVKIMRYTIELLHHNWRDNIHRFAGLDAVLAINKIIKDTWDELADIYKSPLYTTRVHQVERCMKLFVWYCELGLFVHSDKTMKLTKADGVLGFFTAPASYNIEKSNTSITIHDDEILANSNFSVSSDHILSTSPGKHAMLRFDHVATTVPSYLQFKAYLPLGGTLHVHTCEGLTVVNLKENEVNITLPKEDNSFLLEFFPQGDVAFVDIAVFKIVDRYNIGWEFDYVGHTDKTNKNIQYILDFMSIAEDSISDVQHVLHETAQIAHTLEIFKEYMVMHHDAKFKGCRMTTQK